MSPATKKFLVKIDNLVPSVIVIAIIVFTFLTGCSGGDSTVECEENDFYGDECTDSVTGLKGVLVCGPDGVKLICNTADSPDDDDHTNPDCTPGAACDAGGGEWGHIECPPLPAKPYCVADDTDDPPNTCGNAPDHWQLISFQGCYTSAQLSGAVRSTVRATGNHSTQAFNGYPGSDPSKGLYEGVELDEFSQTCGPVEISLVTGSDTFSVTVSEVVKAYSLDKTWVDFSWQKVMGYSPSESDYDSSAFAVFLLDLFECERSPSSCIYPSLGPCPPNAVIEEGQSSTISKSGSHCGRAFYVFKSF